MENAYHSVRVIVCLFALITMLFRLKEYPFAVIEQQKVHYISYICNIVHTPLLL